MNLAHDPRAQSYLWRRPPRAQCQRRLFFFLFWSLVHDTRDSTRNKKRAALLLIFDARSVLQDERELVRSVEFPVPLLYRIYFDPLSFLNTYISSSGSSVLIHGHISYPYYLSTAMPLELYRCLLQWMSYLKIKYKTFGTVCPRALLYHCWTRTK